MSVRIETKYQRIYGMFKHIIAVPKTEWSFDWIIQEGKTMAEWNWMIADSFPRAVKNPEQFYLWAITYMDPIITPVASIPARFEKPNEEKTL